MAKPKPKPNLREMMRKVDKTMMDRMPKSFVTMHEKKKPVPPKKGK